MNPQRKRTPWQLALEKRGRQQKRLVEIALTRLEGYTSDAATSQLPIHHVLGIHLGLLALANSSPELVDIKARARWIIHWIVAYCFEQGYDVEDAASENGLLAIESIAVVAATAKKARENQPQARNNVLSTPDGTLLAEPWQHVYQSASKFINALSELSK